MSRKKARKRFVQTANIMVKRIRNLCDVQSFENARLTLTSFSDLIAEAWRKGFIKEHEFSYLEKRWNAIDAYISKFVKSLKSVKSHG